MRLKKISWRNFKSYSNILTEIPFTNNASLNLIIGENGTGKSSISEVITYTLYGKIDNIKNSDIPNRINKNFYHFYIFHLYFTSLVNNSFLFIISC